MRARGITTPSTRVCPVTGSHRTTTNKTDGKQLAVNEFTFWERRFVHRGTHPGSRRCHVRDGCCHGGFSGDASYSGPETASQEITVSSTVSPDSATITDVTVQISGTQQTFLDTESFQTTIEPGNSNVNVGYDGEGQFNIAELKTDESVRFQFVVYPRTIQQESIDAAQVDVFYVQNGQELSNSSEFSVSMTNSSYFEAQRLSDQQGQSDLIDRLGRVALGILIIGSVGGIGFVLYSRVQGGEDRSRRGR